MSRLKSDSVNTTAGNYSSSTILGVTSINIFVRFCLQLVIANKSRRGPIQYILVTPQIPQAVECPLFKHVGTGGFLDN